jgi:hypothetical protein
VGDARVGGSGIRIVAMLTRIAMKFGDVSESPIAYDVGDDHEHEHRDAEQEQEKGQNIGLQ